MSMVACKKPCKQCPWRKDSFKGYLGGNTPEEYAALLHTDLPTDCHITQDQSAPKVCAGYIIVRLNSCKRSKDPEMYTIEKQFINHPEREQCFQFGFQFIEHHKRDD